MTKTPWYSNAKISIKDSTLYIEVELDKDKVQASEKNGFLSSVEVNLHDAKPPVRVNVWVRPWKPANTGRRR